MKNPETWTVDKLATHYELDRESVALVLKYFSEYAVIEKRELPQPMENVSFID